MLTKIIDLGCHVPETGELRVKLLNSPLVKTASSDIQSFWDGIEKTDEESYLWVIGVSAMEYYGCNNNGDAFSEVDLKKRHNTFVDNAHIFLHHVNKDPAKSIGHPVFSWYNDEMHRVELILKIDKTRPGASAIVEKIVNEEPIYVSMGCRVPYDVCSICGNKAPTRDAYCEHLRFNMKKILPDGKQVYAINPNPAFFDISIVRRPADPTAFTLDKMASEGFVDYGSGIASAQLGEISQDNMEKISALSKLSDMIKQLEGQSVEGKDNGETYRVVRDLANHGFDEVEYPDLDCDDCCHMGLSPAGIALSMISSGAPITLGDAAIMSGRHFYGDSLRHEHIAEMLHMLPRALEMLRSRPESMMSHIRPVLSDYGGEFDEPIKRKLILRIVRPVADLRISIIRSLAPKDIEKSAAFNAPVEVPHNLPSTAVGALQAAVNPHGENFAPIEFTDRYGHTVKTSPYSLRLATGEAGGISLAAKALGSALALGAIGSAIAEPNMLRKVLYSTVLGAPAAALLMSDSKKMHNQVGDEIPVSTLMESWKSEKRAGMNVPKAPGCLRWGTVAGMTIPAAMALDYMYNKWKYPYEGASPDAGPVRRGILQTGKFVANHPALSVASGALLGARLPF